MMNWLLLILKILGILIAVIFGILLLVLLLLLFAPFRYRAKVRYGSQPLAVAAGISWLLFVLRVRILYSGQKPVIMARVFGIPVYRSDKEKKPKKKKERSPKKKHAGQKKKKQGDSKQAEQTKRQELPPQELSDAKKLPQQELSGEDRLFLKEGDGAEGAKQQETEQKKGLFLRIADKIKKLRETIRKAQKKLGQLLHRTGAVKELLSKEETKKAIVFAWEQLKHLFRHILPRKAKGTLVYGSGDPCSTGQALGVLAVLYARYGELLSIQPDFEEKRLECDIELKGRIKLFTLLCLTVKVIRNQELKQLIHEFQNIKTIE